MDSREASKVSQVLKSLREIFPVKVRKLEAGDYFFPFKKGALVERKTVFDFVGSMSDRRLWKQLASISESEDVIPVLLLEGDLSQVKKYSKWTEPSMVSGYLSVIFDWNIQIIQSPSLEWSTIILAQMAKRHITEKEPRLYPLKIKPKPASPDDEARIIIESLPHYGPVLADRTLREFKSVENVFHNIHKLQTIEGVGKKVVNDINTVIKHHYREKD